MCVMIATTVVCPVCRGDIAIPADKEDGLRCSSCGRDFAVVERIVDFGLNDSGKRPAIYDDPNYQKLNANRVAFHASYYREGSLSRWMENQLKQALYRMVTVRQSPVLDIGCGTGSSFGLLGASPDVIGIDSNLDLLRVCRRKYPEVSLFRADIGRLPFRDGGVSTVFLHAILEHLFHLEEALEEVHRVLTDVGRAYVLIPNEGALGWDIPRRLFGAAKNGKAVGLTASQYIQAAKIEHCNTTYAIDNAIRKFFNIESERHWPLNIGGPMVNLARLYRLVPRK